MCVGITRPKYVDTNAGARAFRITRIKPTPQTRCNRLTDLAGGGRGFRLEAFARPHRLTWGRTCVMDLEIVLVKRIATPVVYFCACV